MNRRTPVRFIVRFAACIAILLAGPIRAEDVTREVEGKVVMPGSNISIAYTLRLKSGEVLDETEPGRPITFKQGAKQVISGLNDAVLGMKLGEKKYVEIPPEKAYGEKDPEALRAILLSELPEGADVPGTELGTEDRRGRPILMRVDRIEGDHAIVDFNHPLAGKTLVYQLEIVVIE